jgi:hypothetical protein
MLNDDLDPLAWIDGHLPISIRMSISDPRLYWPDSGRKINSENYDLILTFSDPYSIMYHCLNTNDSKDNFITSVYVEQSSDTMKKFVDEMFAAIITDFANDTMDNPMTPDDETYDSIHAKIHAKLYYKG